MEQQREVNTNQRNKMTKDEQVKAMGKTENKIVKDEVKNSSEKKVVPKETTKSESKIDEKSIKETSKIEVKKDKKPKVRKTESTVSVSNLPISTKHSAAICKFIKGKTIAEARRYLEQVEKIRKAIPMKGEIPHRKGKMMSGRFPKKAAKNFIVLLKSLAGNSQDIDEPVITEAIANIGERPYGKFGRVRKKRTHIFIRAMEKSKFKELNKKKAKKKQNGRKKNS